MLHLPIANVTVSIFQVFALGCIGGFASGLYGVGGGIIITPLLIFYGIPSYVVIGTSSLFLLGTSLSGTLRNLSAHKIDFLAGTIMFFGSFFGSIVGSHILKHAIANGSEELFVSVVYAAVMFFVLVPMYMSIVKNTLLKFWHAIGSKVNATSSVEVESLISSSPEKLSSSFSVFSVYSSVAGIRYSVLLVIFIGFITGLASSLMGIGGGIIVVPVMVYLLHMPFDVASSTSLYQLMLMSLNLLCIHSRSGSVDVLLGIILIMSSSMCVHFGIVLQKKLGSFTVQATLCMVLTVMFFLFLSKLFVTPDNIFMVK